MRVFCSCKRFDGHFRGFEDILFIFEILEYLYHFGGFERILVILGIFRGTILRIFGGFLEYWLFWRENEAFVILTLEIKNVLCSLKGRKHLAPKQSDFSRLTKIISI